MHDAVEHDERVSGSSEMGCRWMVEGEELRRREMCVCVRALDAVLKSILMPILIPCFAHLAM